MMFSNKVKFLVVLSVISFIDCKSQGNLDPPSNSRTANVQNIYNINQLISPVEYSIEGTPYFTDTYSKGSAYSSAVNIYDKEMRYNIFYDRMEYKDGGTMFAIDPDLTIEKIVLGTLTFVVDNYKVKNKMVPSYFLRLDSGRVTLMTKMRIIFKDRQQGKAIEGNIPATYQRQPDFYYFKLGDGPLMKVRSIKKLIDALPDQKQKMEKFARSEKISANKSEELTKFIEYYNSLPSGGSEEK